MRPSSQETADFVTFTEEILNGKPHFLCSERYQTPLVGQLKTLKVNWPFSNEVNLSSGRFKIA